jgi:hypothetical protein
MAMLISRVFWIRYAVLVGVAVFFCGLSVVPKVLDWPGSGLAFLLGFVAAAIAVIVTWMRLWHSMRKIVDSAKRGQTQLTVEPGAVNLTL